MPRVSKEKSELTKQKIIQVSIDIVLEEGYEHLTFSNIALRVNISRSGTNAHFKRKEDIVEAIKPIFGQKIGALFCYDSPKKFLESWKNVIDTNKEARRMMYSIRDMVDPREGMIGLMNAIQGDKKEVEDTVFYAIGYATYGGKFKDI
ncbi:HTH-type transcriptional regulator, TetR family [Aliivibrio wodanis]|uniref:HTH-type transcriptional regulator, TetR family n=1 Tax=Aliivibrio wodanis TaxID=80852 RepID=A0A090I5M2_9GAMM|nr:HTH-type transcriptional regulator, TetR family [Aliivibrio wodanis]